MSDGMLYSSKTSVGKSCGSGVMISKAEGQPGPLRSATRRNDRITDSEMQNVGVVERRLQGCDVIEITG